MDMPLDPETETALLLDPGNGEWVDVAAFVATGEPLAPVEGEVRPLPAWSTLPVPDLSDPQREVLLMEGGAMRGMLETRYRGEVMDFRKLASNGMVWAFNGVAHGMDAPMFRTALGRTVHLEMTNRSVFPHAIHLHGHHFEVLTRSGALNTPGDVRDTVLIGGGRNAGNRVRRGQSGTVDAALSYALASGSGHDGLVRGRVTFWFPLLTGVGLGGVTVALMAIGGVMNQRGTWATAMVAIASFYVVFAIQSGETQEIVVHAGLAAGFVALAIIRARSSSWILAAALLGHGIFDVFASSVIGNPAPGWWGPFCLGVDVVLAWRWP